MLDGLICICLSVNVSSNVPFGASVKIGYSLSESPSWPVHTNYNVFDETVKFSPFRNQLVFSNYTWQREWQRPVTSGRVVPEDKNPGNSGGYQEMRDTSSIRLCLISTCNIHTKWSSRTWNDRTNSGTSLTWRATIKAKPVVGYPKFPDHPILLTKGGPNYNTKKYVLMSS